MFPVFGGNSPDNQYKIERSLRFNSPDSAYLSRTPVASSNRKTWTWSAWVKRANLGSVQALFAGNVGNTTAGSDLGTAIRFDASDCLEIFNYTNSAYNFRLLTTQVFRDPSAWYHIIVAFDTTQITAANRIKLYVNGVQVTAFSTATYPAQNTDYNINNSAALHTVGVERTEAANLQSYLNGYLTEVHFIDGAALGPEHFGETDVNTGVWKPKQYDTDGPVEYVIIAGGGSGNQGYINTSNIGGGGGGAGGYRSSVAGESSGGGSSAEAPLYLTRGLAYSVTVGAGGVFVSNLANTAASGNNSTFASITSLGGGGGGMQSRVGGNGGSGGGGGGNLSSAAGSGTAGQGYAGGAGAPSAGSGGGGGGAGGAGVAGSNTASTGGDGGAGLASSITGASVTRAAGGLGARTSATGAAGAANTGNGGGGGMTLNAGGNGGSGVIILRYPLQYTATFSAGITQTTSIVGTNRVSVITAAGPTDTVVFS